MRGAACGRDHVEGECRASECSLLCHDLHRLNYTHIIVDPGVQLGYERYDAAGLHVSDVVRLPRMQLPSALASSLL